METDNVEDEEADLSSRRSFLQSSMTYLGMIGASAIMSASLSIASANARNLPLSNGADTSKTGTIDALKPIVLLRYSLSDLKRQLRNKQTLDLEGMPTTEENFKRIFDAYSDPVSYKQKFMDQNAFLVYYSKGFDGPGRPNIEDDPSLQKQTLQFGARNEAWINWENFLVELKYIPLDDDPEKNEAFKYLDDTLRSVDNYIKLAPPEDVKEAQKEVEIFW